MSKHLHGVMPALLTPFNPQQQLDIPSLRRLVQFNIAQGVDGLYVGALPVRLSFKALRNVSRFWKSSQKKRKVK